MSPARPEAAKTASLPRDAPFTMRRSQLIEILNVPHTGKELLRQLGVGFASDFDSPAALHAERRVLARRGWAGEKSGLFEHPAMILRCYS